MNKKIISTAAIFGLLAVITGAFGAHGLKDKITPSQLEVWHTAVQYQFYHVFALLFLSTFTRFDQKLVNAAYLFFTIGIILFSGSLYLLACRNLIGWDNIGIIGPVTPLGGLFFILGWGTVAFAAIRNK